MRRKLAIYEKNKKIIVIGTIEIKPKLRIGFASIGNMESSLLICIVMFCISFSRKIEEIYIQKIKDVKNVDQNNIPNQGEIPLNQILL